jgi:stage II sporulation protein E
MFYGFICDGMGSGEAAGATAGLCKTFLSSMLSYGNKKSTTLEMLNMFISNKNTECFSTVDLLEIDLLCGKACFVKSGAAASYIVRRGDVFKIASGTVPIGILQEVNAQITEFDLCEGDVIVMCSDGAITDTELGEEECEMRLAEFLEYEWRLEVNEMAEKILAEVSFRTKRADDVSICVYRIKKAK